MLPFCRFSLYFIHIILLTWTRIELFWRMIEIFIQSPGTEVEFLTFFALLLWLHLTNILLNGCRIWERFVKRLIARRFSIRYVCYIVRVFTLFFQGYHNLPDTFLGQLKCHLYFFASRQVDNSICLNIVLTLCLWNMNIKIKLLKWSTLWRKNKFRACRVESTREDYSLVESLCQGGGMTQHFLEHLPFYTLSDTVKKLIGLQY